MESEAQTTTIFKIGFDIERFGLNFSRLDFTFIFSEYHFDKFKESVKIRF